MFVSEGSRAEKLWYVMVIQMRHESGSMRDDKALLMRSNMGDDAIVIYSILINDVDE